MSQPLRPISFPLHGTRLIEASAGTGKTFTIAALYVRLVLNHGGDDAFGRPLAPAEILVVTFTKAATEELRDRIRTNLADAARMFRGESVDHPFLSLLRAEYAPEFHAGLARRLELAANSMDDAAIFTIHGWAQRMLRQHAFDSGRAFNTEIEEQLDQLWQEAARDYWRTFAYSLSPDAYTAFVDALGSVDNLPTLTRQYPQTLHSLNNRSFESLRAWESACQELEAKARVQWCQEEAALVTWFEAALTEGRLNRASHKDDAVRSQLQGLCDWAADRAPFMPDSHGKLGSARLKLKKGVTAPDSAALELISALCEQRSLPEELAGEIQAHAAAWCHARVETQKKRRARMTFDDMLRHLDQAFEGPGGPRLTATIRQHFPVALIDEFQDTDPEQYRIFRQIYGQDQRLGFFMIGDPKQAIYGFRGADIYTYLAARRDSEGQHYTLDTNFRSIPPLVDGVNQLFQYAANRPEGAFLLGREIPFSAVQSQQKSQRLEWSGRALAGLTIWSRPPQSVNEIGVGNREPVAFNNKNDYLATLSAGCASEICRLLSAADKGEVSFTNPDRALHPSDIAILVRDFNEAGSIRSALAQRGIRSAYLSDQESVFASAEAADLLTWLRAVAEAERESLIRDALANRTLNLDLALLDIHNEDELAWEARVEQFRHYRTLWQERGVLALVRQFLDDFELPRQLLARDEGERVLTNLLHLAELLQGQAAQLDGEQALIRFLSDQIENGGSDLGEEAVLRLESDEDLIKVVTFHKSKGLEYPLVFIPFAGLCRPVKKTRGPLIGYHDAAGVRRYGSPKDQAALEQADRERLAEDLRLLYVALTRPRYACWAGLLAYGQETSKGYSCKLAPSALAYILNGGQELPPEALWPALEALCRQAPAIGLTELPAADDKRLGDENPATHEAPTPKLPRRRRCRPAPPWWITSYSAMLSGATHAETDTEAEPEWIEHAGDSRLQENTLELRNELPERSAFALAGNHIHALPRGPAIGNFLHAILQWLAEQGFGTVLSDPERLRAHLAIQCARQGLEDWADALLAHFQILLQIPLSPISGTEPSVSIGTGTNTDTDSQADQRVPALGQLPGSAYRAELEFLFPIHHADAAALDRTVREHILPGRRRPELRSRNLNGMLKGYIDLVFEAGGRYYVLDYKSNWLGENDAAYTRERMAEAMLEHRYDLQYALYILAVHRLLKARLPDYDYATHIGGVYYLFLRGCGGRESGQGIFTDRPPQALIEALDALCLSGSESPAAGADYGH